MVGVTLNALSPVVAVMVSGIVVEIVVSGVLLAESPVRSNSEGALLDVGEGATEAVVWVADV